MSNVIEISNLKKVYDLPRADRKSGKINFEAVKGISFSVKKGEIFGILVPNGAGKTTTLEIIEGLKKQTSGEVVILGLDNRTSGDEIKKRIGVQLQSSEYMNLMTLSELLELFTSLYESKANVDELLGFVNLVNKKNSLVKDLSGGQKQRFTLASGLVNDPEVLFLDEPTTGLDPRARRDVWELVRRINEKGVTIVLTTHYMEEAEYLCNRVAIMDSGEVLAINDPSQLINSIATTTQVSFLTEDVISQELWDGINGVEEMHSLSAPKVILEINNLDAVGPVIKRLRDRKINFSSFTVKTATLEDVYLDLTGKVFEV